MSDRSDIKFDDLMKINVHKTFIYIDTIYKNVIKYISNIFTEY